MYRRYPLIRLALALTVPLAILALASGLLVLLSYPLEITVLIRPEPLGPGSHPLSALGIILLAASMLLYHHRLPSLVLALPVWLLMLSRLLMPDASQALLQALTPFTRSLALINESGHPVALGVHTALCQWLIASAILSYQLYHPKWAQLLSTLAFAVAQVALTGYAFGLSHFYGEMSLTTMMMVTPMSLAILVRTANRGGLRALLSPWTGGKIARLQLVVGMVTPFLIGLLLVKTADRAPDLSFGMLIVAVSQASALLIAVSAILYETMDKERRSYHRQMELMATRDPLTASFNRYALERRAETELARSRRHRYPLSVLVVDADHFKQINDNFGHPVGDLVLQQLASLLRRHCRAQDTVARWGGEEFVVLLPDTPLNKAFQVAEKLRQLVAQQDLHDLAPGLSLTISVGCAQLTAQENISDLLRRADIALYAAKDLGRNKVSEARLAS
ncbi:GGDEF domain-containing protein [Gallaecimonas xiamenensis]|uniref:diguanylate cyclase n=1 Tax=Gallaecimonas xiamenensis 3-C-1 TaxID=745411 RepID=K2K4I2_9GAMM|nr:GGDEF domain-containing protein [Gallaecimonas xiamenensis]EKE72385.1 diguanylate cyclase [Gallaecimonas xiamenensis 3-C-1]